MKNKDSKMTAEEIRIEWEKKNNPFYPDTMKYRREHLTSVIEYASQLSPVKDVLLKWIIPFSTIQGRDHIIDMIMKDLSFSPVKQESDAMGFILWLGENNYLPNDSNGTFFKKGKYSNLKPTSDLYQLFLKEKGDNNGK